MKCENMHSFLLTFAVFGICHTVVVFFAFLLGLPPFSRIERLSEIGVFLTWHCVFPLFSIFSLFALVGLGTWASITADRTCQSEAAADFFLFLWLALILAMGIGVKVLEPDLASDTIGWIFAALLSAVFTFTAVKLRSFLARSLAD